MAYDIICQATHEIRHVQLFCQPTQRYNKTQTCQLPRLKIEVKTGKNMFPTAETESATYTKCPPSHQHPQEMELQSW